MSDQEAEESDEDVAAEAEDAAEETEGFEEGDFVKLAYTARTVEDDTLVDTTDREIAEDEGVAEEGQTFEPRTIVLGAGHLFGPVEDAIVGGEVGDEGTVTVPAEEAFGEFDEDEVRTVSAEKIPEDERYPGAHIEIDGQHGHLETIIGGRARVDFNHPLAGEDIEYEYEVLDQIEDRVEKAQSLLSTYLDVDLDMHIETDEVEEMQPVEPDEDEEAEGEDHEEAPEPEFEEVTVEKETLYVESDPQLAFNQQWMFQKQQIAQEIIERVGVDRVIVQEIIDGAGGMMGGMGGMMPGMGGGGGAEELEDAVDAGELEDAIEEGDVDLEEATAEDVVEELEGGEE
ncbi:peptidylprolyl isomerase [Halobacteriales archaeon QS_1_68_20]|nr:MAG: peptidylprolyl isomerase [Halobacteriales archaeon QS_1_68_20]